MFTTNDIATVKGMLVRGDKQHDIAAYFKCNSGRIAEIATGKVGNGIKAAPSAALPSIESGPRYIDPNAPLEKQSGVLDQLRKNPPENSRRIVTQLDAIKKQALGRVHETQRNAMLVLTLNAYVAGKSVTKSTIEWTTLEDFPVFS